MTLARVLNDNRQAGPWARENDYLLRSCNIPVKDGYLIGYDKILTKNGYILRSYKMNGYLVKSCKIFYALFLCTIFYKTNGCLAKLL